MGRNRIGVFGGTFDPIHVGHLAAAAGARYSCGLDKVLLMVANDQWQKSGTRAISDPEARFRSVAAAVAGHAGLEASRLEIDRGGVSYMADTLALLKVDNPESDLFLIVGVDTAARIETWQRWQIVAELAELAVVNRPGEPALRLGPIWHVNEVVIPAIDVSSTDLRARFADGRPLDFLIPEAALESMRRDGLYPVSNERQDGD